VELTSIAPYAINDAKSTIKSKRKLTKLDHLKLGPFRIKRRLDYDNYELELTERMRIHPILIFLEYISRASITRVFCFHLCKGSPSTGAPDCKNISSACIVVFIPIIPFHISLLEKTVGIRSIIGIRSIVDTRSIVIRSYH
jgi:hypothetical protein